MELIKQFDSILKKFDVKDASFFNGSNIESNDYILGITPQDPNNIGCYYINVTNVFTIKNKEYGVVLHLNCWCCFMVKIETNESITPQFYFDLICKSYEPFVEIFQQKTIGTHLNNHKPTEPMYLVLKRDIQKTIDIWNNTLRHTSLN